MSAEKTTEEMIEYMNNAREKLNKIRDETPDPICCKKCGEFKTDNNDLNTRLLYGSLERTAELSNEQLRGGIHMMNYISGYLDYTFNYEKQVFSREVLILTLDEICKHMVKCFRHPNPHDEPLDENRENEVESLISEYNYGHGF